MKKTVFNPALLDMFHQDHFKLWFEAMGYEGKWEDAWRSIGGNVKRDKPPKEVEEE